MKIEKGEGWLCLELSGDVDLAWYERHRADLDSALEGNASLVVFNLEHVGFMDSTGLALVARAYRQCPEEDAEVYVLHPAPIVAHTLAVSGLDEVVTIVTDRREVTQIYDRLAGSLQQPPAETGETRPGAAAGGI